MTATLGVGARRQPWAVAAAGAARQVGGVVVVALEAGVVVAEAAAVEEEAARTRGSEEVGKMRAWSSTEKCTRPPWTMYTTPGSPHSSHPNDIMVSTHKTYFYPSGIKTKYSLLLIQVVPFKDCECQTRSTFVLNHDEHHTLLFL